MTPERWKQVKALFEDALAWPSDDRPARLASACGPDRALFLEVESLLASHNAAGGFLEHSALAAAAEMLDAPDPGAPGRRLGAYRIVREIGRGGMGTVYLAERDDAEFRKQVAIKVIKRGMDTDLIVRRFRHERQILANLDHPGVARLLDGGATPDGLPYFVMEYIEGEPLDRYASSRALSVAERLALFRSVCAPVQFAHQNLVVHRDLKPGNILVTAVGVPKLLDFGLAKLLSAERSAGLTLATSALHALTPEYASPEQRHGGPITTSTDVYSLGVILHELLTGQRPVHASPLPHRALRGDLGTIVQMALREEPERRYASVEQMSEDVRRYLAALPVSARPDTFGYRSGRFIRRNRVGVAAALLVGVVLVGGILATGWQARVARTERVRADAQRQLAEGRFDDVRVLVNSLLFDLDGQLSLLPGSTPARELLVKRSLEYLDRLSRETQDNRLLEQELAEAYLKVGDIQGKPYSANVGDTDGALASYRKARALLDDLVRAEPSRAQVRRALSVAHQRMSVIEVRQGKWEEGRRSGELGRDVAAALVETDSSNLDNQGVLADAYLYLGQAQYRGGQPGSTAEGRRLALDSYGRSLAIRERLAALDPTPTRRGDVANSHAHVGYAHWVEASVSGDTSSYRTALAALLRAQAVRQRVLVEAPSPRARRIAADGLREIGTLHTKLGETREAMRRFEEALPMMEILAAADPANVEARRDLASAHLTISPALAQLGATTRARAHARIALAMLNELRVLDPTSNEDRKLVAEARALVGDLDQRPASGR